MEELITEGDEAPAYICAVCKSRTSVQHDQLENKLTADIRVKEEEIKAKDKLIAQLQRKLEEAMDSQNRSPSLLNPYKIDDSMDRLPSSPELLARNIKKSF